MSKSKGGRDMASEKKIGCEAPGGILGKLASLIRAKPESVWQPADGFCISTVPPTRRPSYTTMVFQAIPNIISPSDFNAIPDIHDQVDFPYDPALFTTLGKVFKKYYLHERFGVHLLHRHFILPEDHLMLKLKIDEEISVTKVTSLHSIDNLPVRGVLYLLNDMGTFQAYEFEHGDAVDIPSLFLEELAEILRKFKMEKVIALDIGEPPAGHGTSTSFEYVLGDKRLPYSWIRRSSLIIVKRDLHL